MTNGYAETLALHKIVAGSRAIFGVGLIVAGVLIRVPLLGPLVGTIGFLIALRAFTRLIRIHYAQRNLDWSSAYAEFRQSSLPRQVFLLLLGVAEVDGHAAEEERALVRNFLLERFSDPITAHDLRTWEAQRIPSQELGALATSLRKVLTSAERETIFYWCCQITFVDGRFRSDEHEALQTIARGLHIRPNHARTVFHHAKARHLGQGGGQSWGQQGPRTSRGPSHAPASARDRALATLGLEEGASRDDVRKRHRELVKRYHPDAHSHLGPVAAAEAETRFREVQEAYELLSR